MKQRESVVFKYLGKPKNNWKLYWAQTVPYLPATLEEHISEACKHTC
jgi:hypothetical protein